MGKISTGLFSGLLPFSSELISRHEIRINSLNIMLNIRINAGSTQKRARRDKVHFLDREAAIAATKSQVI